MVKNKGTLFLDHFWAFWAFWDKTVEFPGLLLDSKVLKRTVHHPYGATSDALQRVYFVSAVSLLPKYTL